MFGIRRGLLLIILIAAASAFIGSDAFKDMFSGFLKDKVTVVLTEQAQKHILYGNRNGGGHKFGTGKPCKSEFPQGWNDEKIISTVQELAANDNLPWKKQDNGYFVADDFVDGVKIRVVLDREKDGIVTAYPLNGKRNPCVATKDGVKIPAPANDNFNE